MPKSQLCALCHQATATQALTFEVIDHDRDDVEWITEYVCESCFTAIGSGMPPLADPEGFQIALEAMYESGEVWDEFDDFQEWLDDMADDYEDYLEEQEEES